MAIISTRSFNSFSSAQSAHTAAALGALFTYARDFFFRAGSDEHFHVPVCETTQHWQNLVENRNVSFFIKIKVTGDPGAVGL